MQKRVLGLFLCIGACSGSQPGASANHPAAATSDVLDTPRHHALPCREEQRDETGLLVGVTERAFDAAEHLLRVTFTVDDEKIHDYFPYQLIETYVRELTLDSDGRELVDYYVSESKTENTTRAYTPEGWLTRERQDRTEYGRKVWGTHEWQFDSNGRWVQQTVQLANEVSVYQSYVQRREYDVGGRLLLDDLRFDNGQGTREAFAYDRLGRLMTRELDAINDFVTHHDVEQHIYGTDGRHTSRLTSDEQTNGVIDRIIDTEWSALGEYLTQTDDWNGDGRYEERSTQEVVAGSHGQALITRRMREANTATDTSVTIWTTQFDVNDRPVYSDRTPSLGDPDGEQRRSIYDAAGVEVLSELRTYAGEFKQADRVLFTPEGWRSAKQRASRENEWQDMSTWTYDAAGNPLHHFERWPYPYSVTYSYDCF